MRAYAEWSEHELALVVESELHDVVSRLGFLDGRRVFPSDAPYARQAAERFERCAESMVLQLAEREHVPWEDALELVLERIGPNGWTLVGSAARALRGIDASPHDLDLVSDAAGADRIAAALADLLVEPVVDGGWIGARWWRAFGPARIEGVGDFAGTIVDEGTVAWRGHVLRVGSIA